MLNVLNLFGGIGLFLFGMSLMGSSLEKLAGSGLEKILGKFTTSKKKGVGAIKGWGLGLGVTGIIQSSAATTIMLIGFVNAGIMTLVQAIPVVFGANVGSTVTAQILRLGDLGSGSLFLQLLKPSSFANILLAFGAIIYLFTKKQRLKDVAGIMVGLGTLFYGMTLMEATFEPLKESEKFQSFFTSFSNPFIGILTGLLLTAIIQSSSASVGILQALSATGSVTFGVAVPIIIGQNIGKCFTIIIGSIGANKKAKRVALSYLLFNLVGAIVFSTIIYAIYYTVGIPVFSKTANRGDIANIHLGFNLIISLVLLPFSNKMATLTGKILRDSDEAYGDEELRKLDDMLLKTPGIALNQCKVVMTSMGEKIRENYESAIGLFKEFDKSKFNAMVDNENFIDRCETELSAYVLKINRKRLTIDNRNMLTAILNSIGDYERIGDYSMNIAYNAQECYENKIVFSPKGQKEIDIMTDATSSMLSMVFGAADGENINEAYKILPLSKTINKLKDIIESHHVERLQDGDCGVVGGVALYDLANSIQGITLHAKNISKHIIKRLSRNDDLDALHGKMMNESSEEYAALMEYYNSRYIDALNTKEIVVSEDEKEPEQVEERTGLTGILTKVVTKSDKDDKKSKKDEKDTKADNAEKKAKKTDKSSVKDDKPEKSDKKSGKSDKVDKSGKTDKKDHKEIKNDKTEAKDKKDKSDKKHDSKKKNKK
ncbi:MAG TPA: Na/Pi cotransporter family protein [Lachnospiraceae bacterium]|nr:Na/Pi cotransporter family protein [Lachnospiraceae bacterium]